MERHWAHTCVPYFRYKIWIEKQHLELNTKRSIALKFALRSLNFIIFKNSRRPGNIIAIKVWCELNNPLKGLLVNQNIYLRIPITYSLSVQSDFCSSSFSFISKTTFSLAMNSKAHWQYFITIVLTDFATAIIM